MIIFYFVAITVHTQNFETKIILNRESLHFFCFIFQKEKYNRQVEYARQVAEKNRVKLENSSRKVGPPRPKEDPVKEDLLDRRRIVSSMKTGAG